MATNVERLARFHMHYEKEFSIQGNRPLYTCKKCGETKERGPGDFETAICCGDTIPVHFSKE